MEHELHSVGIRLNCTKPNIYLKRKTAGGISFNSTCTLTKITQRTVNIILKEYKMHHVEVLFHEDCTSGGPPLAGNSSATSMPLVVPRQGGAWVGWLRGQGSDYSTWTLVVL